MEAGRNGLIEFNVFFHSLRINQKAEHFPFCHLSYSAQNKIR